MTQQSPTTSTRRAGGFTLVELTLGLAVVAGLGLVAVGVIDAMARSQTARLSGDVEGASRRIVSMLDARLRGAAGVAHAAVPTAASPVALVLWRGDLADYGPGGDGVVQVGECEFVVHDVANGRLELLRFRPLEQITDADAREAALLAFDPASLSGEELQKRTRGADRFVLCEGVSKVAAGVNLSGQRPLVRYRLRLGEGEQAQGLGGAVAIQAPPVAGLLNVAGAAGTVTGLDPLAPILGALNGR